MIKERVKELKVFRTLSENYYSKIFWIQVFVICILNKKDPLQSATGLSKL
jgi:hypothetical protein